MHPPIGRPKNHQRNRLMSSNVILCVALSASLKYEFFAEPNGDAPFPFSTSPDSQVRPPSTGADTGMGTVRGARPPRTVEGEGSPGKRI